MLAKRIIPCLDVKDGVVVKGVKFRGHEVMGEIVPLARRYAEEGADELVFYDITASSDGRVVDKSWISRVAEAIAIPFWAASALSRTPGGFSLSVQTRSPSTLLRSRIQPSFHVLPSVSACSASWSASTPGMTKRAENTGSINTLEMKRKRV